MRWPWVNRALYEASCQASADALTHARSEKADVSRQWAVLYRDARDDAKRSQALFTQERKTREQRDEEIAALRRGDLKAAGLARLGPELRALVSPPPPASPKEPSIVSQVIREQSGGDPRLAGYLRSYATRLERDGESPEDIALHLSEWESTEGYTLPAEVSI